MPANRHVLGLVVIAVVVFFGYLLFPPGSALGAMVIQVALLGTIYSLSGDRRVCGISLVVSTAGILLFWCGHFTDKPPISTAGVAVFALAIAYMSIAFVAVLMRMREVTVGGIAAAITGYLMLGLLWAVVYIVLIAFDPDAIRGAASHDDCIYFSFVTLTTLGYGDVLPTTTTARSLATLEAVVGQLYIAVTIARLIGLSLMETHAAD